MNDRTETRCIQAWPRGTSYRVSGEHAPDRPGYGYTIHDGDTSRPATDAEALEIIVAEIAERLADRDVLACHSALVSDLIKADFDGFSFEDIANLTPDPDDWTIEQCRAWLDDMGCAYDEPDEIDDEDEAAEMMRETVRGYAEPAEIFEWWAVSKWLAEELGAIGEPVIDNGYGQWWGRTCTGQSYIMDGTLQQIAANLIARTP